MEARRFVLLVVCISSVVVIADDGMEGVQDFTVAKPPPKPPGANRLTDKIEAVTDLDDEAERLRTKRRKERTTKAQKAVVYMEKYKARKASFAKEGARLRNRIDRDKMEVLKSTPSLRKAHERHKKHDSTVQETMRRALVAMKKVNNLVHGKQKADPTVKMAQKALAKTRGKEIFTVLGLDANQLGKDYLLSMDAAVAAYDAKPSPKSEYKLAKTIKVTKERMSKAKLERKKKSEIGSKKERSKKNQVYYKSRWHEKLREMARKKLMRATLVKQLKNEGKHKAWVRRKNEDEKEIKSGKTNAEKRAKKAAENAVKSRKAKVILGKHNIEKTAKAKWNTAQKKLNDVVTSKKSDAMKKLKSEKNSKEKVGKGKVNMERTQKNVSAAGKMSAAAAKAFGTASEKKGKAASELNQKGANKAQAYMRAKASVKRVANFKEKGAKAKYKELGKKSAVSKLALKAANGRKRKAIKKAALHRATKKKPPKKSGSSPKKKKKKRI